MDKLERTVQALVDAALNDTSVVDQISAASAIITKDIVAVEDRLGEVTTILNLFWGGKLDLGEGHQKFLVHSRLPFTIQCMLTCAITMTSLQQMKTRASLQELENAVGTLDELKDEVDLLATKASSNQDCFKKGSFPGTSMSTATRCARARACVCVCVCVNNIDNVNKGIGVRGE